jgi:heparanase 1
MSRAVVLSLVAVAGASSSDHAGDVEGTWPLPPGNAAVALDLANDRPAAETEPRFLSVAVDTAQVVGGEFWAPPGKAEGLLKTHVVDRFDFSQTRLRNLARGLAPAYLRIGGTAADWTVYRMDDAAASAPLPAGARWSLSRRRWDEVNQFARDVDFRVMFTLNAGASARTADGGWDPSNARELIRYSQQRGYPIDVWELGNEANAFPLVHRIWLTADRYAADLLRARALLDETGTDARLAGLGSAFWPVLGEWHSFTDAVLRRAGGALDIVTWHYYPLQSHRCPIATRRARAGRMPGPAVLDDVERWAGRVEEAAHAHAPQAAVWLGETGSAQCGGEPGLSNSYADALWWLDELGRVARRGQGVVVRQTLSGADYGLVDDRTLEPNPSYWASWLWRSLMGRRVLAVSVGEGATPGLRTYAHCLRGDPAPAGAVVMLLLNVDARRDIDVDLPAGAGRVARVYRFEADGPAVRSVRLDGVPLAADAEGRPPALARFDDRAASALPAGSRLAMPALSAAFVVLPDAGAAACHEQAQELSVAQ